MITEKELLQAIRDCERDPMTYGSCEKLANFYVIYDHLFGDSRPLNYPPTEPEKVVSVAGDSEFLKSICGAPADKVWVIVDELVGVIEALHPRMYDAFIDKLRSL